MKSPLLNPPVKIGAITSKFRHLNSEAAEKSGPDANGRPEQPRKGTPLFFISRLIFCGFVLCTSFWCLLAYVRITYLTVVNAPSQTLLPSAFRLHSFFFWPILLLIGCTLWPDLKAKSTRRITITFLSLLLIAGIFCLFQQPFSHLKNNGTSYLASLFALVPLLGIAFIDIASSYSAVDWNNTAHAGSRRSGAFFSASFILIGVLITEALNLACVHIRHYMLYKSPNPYRNEWLLVIASVVTQVIVLLFCLSLVHAGRRFAAQSRNSEERRFWIDAFLLWLVLGFFFLRVPLKVLMLGNLLSGIYAVAVALAIAAIVAGIRLRKAAVSVESRVARRLKPAEQVLILSILLLLNYCMPGWIGNLDWQYLLTRLWGLTFCAAIMALLYYSRGSWHRAYRLPVVLLFVSVSIAGNVALHASERSWPRMLKQKNFNATEALESYATSNNSYMLARSLLAGVIKDPCDNFCYFLKENSNLAAQGVPSKQFELVDRLASSPGTKPNIFIFVVDSLRQDYVSAYNPAVDFTPEIQKFAHDSVVMRKAFTPYGGTALSEPAIWSGALQLHMLYVQPYRGINSLEKLITAEGYHNYVAMDHILQQILAPDTPVTDLDDEAATFSGGYDLCNTVAHAEALFDKRQDSKPIFFFAQPQNIHGTTLHALPISYRPRRQYSGFSPKYASELERLDGCFGDFIRDLQKRGLYENSIIVLTADHGEAMDEELNSNHSFSLRPEILKVPLIFHVPARLGKKYSYDANQIAFTVDITPSIYYLLGHTPIQHNELFGRPLFTLTRGEQTEYLASEYLVASSYGPVFGILTQDAGQLYIDDAVGYRRRFYDLKADPSAKQNLVNDEIQLRYEQLIRRHLNTVANFYGFKKRSELETFRNWLTR